MSQDKKPNAYWLAAKPFVNGGLSGMLATCIIQPIDMIKVRIQIGDKGGPFVVGANIIKKDGFLALYKGLDAGLLRQATYTTARLGLFNNFSAALKEYNGGANLPLWQKAAAGLAAGGLGALVGNPADLTLIRMQGARHIVPEQDEDHVHVLLGDPISITPAQVNVSIWPFKRGGVLWLGFSEEDMSMVLVLLGFTMADSSLPPEQRRNYKSIADAFTRIVREDGISGLFRGATPTATRAMALNMGMLASNDQAKESLESLGFGKQTSVLGGAFIAGFFASACSLPFDFVKTRLQKMQALPDGTMPYKSSLDCAVKTFTQEGPLAFYTGFPTYIARIGPHVVFTLVFVDLLPKLQKPYGL